MRIEPYQSNYLDAIVHLSLRAWAPVFDSLQSTMNSEVYQAFYPEPWHMNQQKDVENACSAADVYTWVAISDDMVMGFIAVKHHLEDNMGEIYMVAVDPDFQRLGVDKALITFALNWLKDAGMSIVMVETGGDPGHSAARSTYESLGFHLFPVARYFKKL